MNRTSTMIRTRVEGLGADDHTKDDDPDWDATNAWFVLDLADGLEQLLAQD